MFINNLLIFYNETKQIQKEKKIYSQMAWGGDTNAMNHLGMIYAGEGKYHESEEWFLKAAALGDEHAKNNLKVLKNNFKKSN